MTDNEQVEPKPLTLNEVMFPRICSICNVEPLTPVGRIIKACRACRAKNPRDNRRSAAQSYKFGH